MKSHKKSIVLGLVFVFLTLLATGQSLAEPPQQSELALISYPADNEVVRGEVSITGSAVHPSFERFQVTYAPEPVTSNDQWILIGQERTDQVVNGQLAVWDTTAIPDGSYSLRLRVVRLDGNYSETEVKQIVVANAVPTNTPTPSASATPTVTPTPLPPTPTIVIDIPVEDTPTPRALTVTQTLPTPRPDDTGVLPIPRVIFDVNPLRSSCLMGIGAIVALFLLFGFLSLLRYIIIGFAKAVQQNRRKK